MRIDAKAGVFFSNSYLSSLAPMSMDWIEKSLKIVYTQTAIISARTFHSLLKARQSPWRAQQQQAWERAPRMLQA